MSGQINWVSNGTNNNEKEFIVNPVVEKAMFYEYRKRSAIGKLSKPVKSQTFNDGSRQGTMDVAQSSVIATKKITSGDEARFTLEQNIVGSPTYGDVDVRTGDYLSYLHQSVLLNKMDTPAIPIQEDMSTQRVADSIGNQEGAVRRQINMYMAEEYVFDFYRAAFRGMSQGISIEQSKGGLHKDLGRGPGVSVSVENLVIGGRGAVSAPTGVDQASLDAYEQRIVDELTAADSAIGALTDYEAQRQYGVTRSFISDIRDYISDQNIKGVDVGGREIWYCPIDPALLKQLTAPGGELYESWKQMMDRVGSMESKNNRVNNPLAVDASMITLDDLVFLRDPYLKHFRPTYAGSAPQWGTPDLDMRKKFPTSNWAPMLILGETAVLEAHNGSVSTTFEPGKHGKGREIAAHQKISSMRSRWLPKDGRNTAPLNQNSALCLFYTANTFFTPQAP